MSPGLYIYALTFKGRTYSGRLVKASGGGSFSSGSGLEPVMMPPEVSLPDPGYRFGVTSEVTALHYYPVRLTDVTLANDTIIDFVLSPKNTMPFRYRGAILRDTLTTLQVNDT